MDLIIAVFAALHPMQAASGEEFVHGGLGEARSRLAVPANAGDGKRCLLETPSAVP